MINDLMAVKDSARMRAQFENVESLPFYGVFTIEKFWVNPKTKIVEPASFETQRFRNLVVNVGGAIMLDLFIGGGGTVFSNANAYIGIGDSSTAAAAGQTDLQAASNKTRVVMDATFPSRSGQIMTFKATFGTGSANYAWNEIALFNASAAGTMFCRALVSNPFTKTSGLSVTATYTLQLP